MHTALAPHRDAIAALCRRHGVTRLEVFGSAACGIDFRVDGSDVDFLVSFAPEFRNDLGNFLDLKDALQAELGRSVDLVERDAVEASRNHIRRARILGECEGVYD